jgi:hypothetical protein
MGRSRLQTHRVYDRQLDRIGTSSNSPPSLEIIVSDKPPVKTATEARQGQTTGVVRWMLAISLALAIVAMIVAYWAFMKGLV